MRMPAARLTHGGRHLTDAAIASPPSKKVTLNVEKVNNTISIIYKREISAAKDISAVHHRY